MEERKITTTVRTFSYDELPADLSELCQEARRASQGAYAKYSNFKVGAAVRLAGGAVAIGSNQENAAYPSGLCAERTALFSAAANNPEAAPEAIAIWAETAGGQTSSPVPPCGACRQVMTETEQRYGRPIAVLMCSSRGVDIVESAADLMPLSFAEDNML